jgi:hypothetical protein
MEGVEAVRGALRETEGMVGTLGNHPKEDQESLECCPPPLPEGMLQLKKGP